MKFVYLIPVMAACLVPPALAQGAIYRCGNEFSNTLTEADAKARGCKMVSGGNVTIVPAQRVTPRPNTGSARVDNADQRAKDSDSRLILESELKKAEARRVELLKEYNNGEPEKLGPETRNHQKYLDRVAELKENLARNANDIEGLKREIARLPSTPASSSAPR